MCYRSIEIVTQMFSNLFVTMEPFGAFRLLVEPQSNQSIYRYFIVRPKVDQTANQLSLPHVGITNTEKNRTKNAKPIRSVRQTETD